MILAFPQVLSRCGLSVELAVLLKSRQFLEAAWLQCKWPDDDWEALLHTLKTACTAYYRSAWIWKPLGMISHPIKQLFISSEDD
jgi:hypothetical protein